MVHCDYLGCPKFRIRYTRSAVVFKWISTHQNDQCNNDVNLRTQSRMFPHVSDQLTLEGGNNSDVMSCGVLRTGQAPYLVYLCSLLHCLWETLRCLCWCNHHGVCVLFGPYLSCQCPEFHTTPRHSRHVLEALHTHRIPEAPKQHTFWTSLLSDTPVSLSLWHWADEVNQECLIMESVLRASRNRLGKRCCWYFTQYGYRSWVCVILP